MRDFKERYQQLSTCINDVLKLDPKKVKQQSKVKYFRIEHWDKTKIETYTLGNQVGCCVATNGMDKRFEGMIQRRMDDGMFMHVVIDEESELPIALTWLYFAIDKNNKKICIAANFIDIKIRFGKYDHQRDLIVNMLLKFTGTHYANDIGIEKFFIRHLSYGTIPDFKIFDEEENVALAKLGGCFNPEKDSGSTEENPYYLDSLDESIFHVYHLENQEALNLQEYTIESPRSESGALVGLLGVFKWPGSANDPSVGPAPVKVVLA